MTLAAKHMDPVVGIDMHMVQPPPPAPPVMLPVPFVGYLIDPADYAGGCTIHVNGLPRARAGTPGMGCPPHVPPGGVFVKPPTNECEMYQGSSTVVFDGDAASAMGHQVLGCHDVGMVAPVRGWKQAVAKSLMMGSCAVVPVGGTPVSIGGPSIVAARAPSEHKEYDRIDSILESLGLEVYDPFGWPMADADFQAILPNGDIEDSTLSSDGSFTMSDVPRGYVIFRLPRAEAPLSQHDPPPSPPSKHASSTINPGHAGREDQTTLPHVVQPGETIQTIALRYGIPNWRAVHAHASNEALAIARPNPEILSPGDIVNIEQPASPAREYQPGGIVLKTGESHVVFCKPRRLMSLSFRAAAGLWSNADFHCTLLEGVVSGQLSEDSRLRLLVDARQDVFQLKLTSKTQSHHTSFFTIHLGHLDPPTEPWGAAARLINLGYLSSDWRPSEHEALSRAISLFQREFALNPSGVLDSDTASQLTCAFGA